MRMGNEISTRNSIPNQHQRKTLQRRRVRERMTIGTDAGMGATMNNN